MSIITLPQTLQIGAGSGVGQQRYEIEAVSETNGAQQVRVLGPPRWRLALVQPPALSLQGGGEWAALIAALRGRVNHLAAWDPVRHVPAGTMRGTPTLNTGAAAGDSTLSLVTGQPACTLRSGDWLQLGAGLGASQLVMVTGNATADGSGIMSVAIEPPLRLAFSGGAAITWQRASTYYRATSASSQWQYVASAAVGGFALDLLESWS